MSWEKKGSWFHRFCDYISDPGVKKDHNTTYNRNIFPLRLIVFFSVFIIFHALNRHPLSLDNVVIAESLYFALIFALFKKPERTTNVLRFSKIAIDLIFVTYFQYLSLSIYGHSFGIFVLYLMPLIYCSFWFKRSFTFIFTTLVSATYSLLIILLRYPSLPDLSDPLNTLGPNIIVFYWVALGIEYFKKKIQLNYDDIEKIANQHKSQLGIEKAYTFNLFKSSFDGIIAADENGIITDINERACELLEYSKDCILGKPVQLFYDSGEATRVMSRLRNSDDGSVENFKTSILNSRGDKIPILLSTVFLYDRGNIPDLNEALKSGKKFPSIGYFRDLRAEKMIDDLATEITDKAMEEELLDKMVENIAKILRAEVCTLLTYKERTGKLKVKKSFGLPEELKKTEKFDSYDHTNSMIATIFNTRKTLNVNNIDVKNKRPSDLIINWKHAQNFATYSRFGDFRHFMGVPLILYGEVYGVIRILNKYTNNDQLDERGFTKSDEKLLERISNQMSMWVGKVRDQERFETISKVGQELNERLDLSLEEMLETITIEAVKRMRIKACFLRLIEDHNLVIKACFGQKESYKGQEQYNIKIGKGVAGKVVETGNYIMIEDLLVKHQLEHKNIIEKEGLRGMLSVPLKYNSRVIGVINCYTRRPHKFTDQEIRFMHTFAAYATIAIKNKMRVDELVALNDVGQELVKPININKLLKKILEKAKKLSGVDRLCIKSFDKEKKILKTLNALNCPWYDEGYEAKFATDVSKPPWEGIWQKIIETHKTQIIPNIQEIISQIENLQGQEHLKDIKSCALVPIIINNEIYGAIFLESFREDFFGKNDNLLLLNSFSIQAAIALRNADLFGKLEKVTQTFPRISELDSDMGRVLKNIANIAAQVLETDIFLLYRWDAIAEKIIWPPIYTGDVLQLEHMMTEVNATDIPVEFIARGKSHFATDSQTDEIMTSGGREPRKGIPERFVFREKIKSSAGVILRVGQEIVGVMFINYRTRHKFDYDERMIIENYASYIAIAIQNVKHFKEKETATKMQTLGQFATSMVHKIKNDISMIHLHTSDLIDNTTRENPQYDRLIAIKNKVNKIASDLESLRSVSKMKPPEKKPANLCEILNEVELDISTDLKLQHIQMDKTIVGSVPDIEIDPIQVKMVLQNLVYNSFDAMPQGGKITVSISTSANSIMLIWADTGSGILPLNAEKIFAPLWTSKEKGSGLGLYLSRRIIEEHDGSIALDSDHRVGAKFIITFPLKNRKPLTDTELEI